MEAVGKQGEKEALLFLKKKKQKDFIRLGSEPNPQKFFASFFQKRSFLPSLTKAHALPGFYGTLTVTLLACGKALPKSAYSMLSVFRSALPSPPR
jgi:hypothetical protein